MNEHAYRLMQQYRARGVLVDTNILLLLFVGSFDRLLVTKFKRTRDRFTIKDFDFLSKFLAQFERMVTTPNILSEVNGLSNQIGEPVKTRFYSDFAKKIPLLHEEYVASKQAAQVEAFSKLGLTDSGILHLVRGNYLVLTDDLTLYGYLEKAGIDVLNFNHLRPI
jgi:rRNA-processing protein FCF1